MVSWKHHSSLGWIKHDSIQCWNYFIIAPEIPILYIYESKLVNKLNKEITHATFDKNKNVKCSSTETSSNQTSVLMAQELARRAEDREVPVPVSAKTNFFFMFTLLVKSTGE